MRAEVLLVSDFVRVVPRAVVASNRTVPGTVRRAEGAPDRSSRPAIEGRSSDILRSDPVQTGGNNVDLMSLRI